jgi:predicted lipoprotein
MLPRSDSRISRSDSMVSAASAAKLTGVLALPACQINPLPSSEPAATSKSCPVCTPFNDEMTPSCVRSLGPA